MVLFFYDVLLPMVIASMMLFSLDSIVSVMAFFLGITDKLSVLCMAMVFSNNN